MSAVENWASIRGRTHLRVVAELRCDVCDEDGLMELVSLLGLRTAVSTPCPHCRPGEGFESVPLFPTPHRTDRSTA